MYLYYHYFLAYNKSDDTDSYEYSFYVIFVVFFLVLHSHSVEFGLSLDSAHKDHSWWNLGGYIKVLGTKPELATCKLNVPASVLFI